MVETIAYADICRVCPRDGGDPSIADIMSKCHWTVRDHQKIMCSVSGGYDSDIVMDLMERCGGHGKTTYVWNNTGLEYDATKRHLLYLEDKYDVEITRLSPKEPIPVCIKKYGFPFWSKTVSTYLSRLQKHGFQWEDEPFQVLSKRYPGCKAALQFWCNAYEAADGRVPRFNIAYVKGLKEFIITNPPPIPFSAECCDRTKKGPAHSYLEAGGFDLNCTGVRRGEGGQRSATYRSCYDKAFGAADNFRPVFWMTNSQKEAYRMRFKVRRSECYEVWGMKRTGCAGCPFGKGFEAELALAKVFEPKMYKAMVSVFGPSYEYTRKFLEFRRRFQNDCRLKIPGY